MIHLSQLKKPLKDAKVSVDEINEVVMVGGMTRMPIVVKKVKEFFKRDPHQGVNPDEVVAIGAAIQGAILSGDSSVKDITLLDVTPLTLGLETMGGIRTALIDRNSTIPTEKSQIFSTAADNQPAVEIHILQGEREMAADNKTLGKFMLDGITPAPRGIPQIEVIFKIDANGILNVSAKDKATGKQQSITITASTQLDDKEVDALVKEAAAHAEDDKTKKERSEAKIEADSLIFQTEKFIDEMKEKVDASDKEELEKVSKELKELISKDDYKVEEVKEKTKELSTKLQEKGAKMYQKAAAEAEKEKSAEKKDGDKKEDSKSDEPKAEEEKAAEGEVIDKDKKKD